MRAARQALFGPRGLLAPLALLQLAALVGVCLWSPLSLRTAAWVAHLEPLPALALAGAGLGYLLARVRTPGLLAHTLAWGFGLQAVAAAYARAAAPPGDLPSRVEWLLLRVASWVDTVVNAGASNDPLLFALAMAGLSWMLGYSSAWLLFRGNAPWLVIATNAVALLMHLSYAPGSLADHLTGFLFGALLLLAVHNLATRQRLWRRAGMPVERSVPRLLLLGGGLVAASFVTLAWALPPGGVNRGVATAWDRVTRPWQDLERDFDRIFASLNAVENAARGLNFGRTLAPRGSFELGDNPVMEVRAPRPFYFRATTADRYTGQAMTSSDTTGLARAAGEPLLTDDERPDAREEVAIGVRVLASRSAVAFAPEAPLRFDIATVVDVRAVPHDVATIRLDAPLLRNEDYTVHVAASTASIQQLRSAGESYPDWVRSHYLQLPRRLPERLREHAREIARTAATPFDRAVAIESYLRRSHIYSTRVPPVPGDRDWVEFFLFEMEEGYCDFFATSMVVLLRTLGVPARVASGFAPGELDPASGAYVVRENQAHSWVEVYFPRYGWVSFEPSAIRPLPERADVAPPPPPPPPAAAPRTESEQRPRLAADEQDELERLGQPRPAAAVPLTPAERAVRGGAGSLLLLAALSLLTLLLLWTRGLHRLAWYQRPYAKLVRLARWLGAVRPRPTHTPYEVADALSREVPTARSTIRGLADAYVEGTYAGRPPGIDPRQIWALTRRDLARALARHRARRLIRRRQPEPPSD